MNQKEEKINKNTSESLMLIRFVFCFFVCIGLIFLKFKNNILYEEIKNFYFNENCSELINSKEIITKISVIMQTNQFFSLEKIHF